MSATRARPEEAAPAGGAGRLAWVDRTWQRGTERIAALRRRWRWFDHLARAGGRYQRNQGDLLAAGVTYFAFLGLFPVLLLAASVIGLVLAGDALLQRELYDTVREAFPGATGRGIVDELRGAVGAAGLTGLIGLVGFLYAGLRAMDKLRVGMEQIWKGRVDEPEFWRDNLQDLLALVLLGAVGLVSLALTGAATTATSWTLELLGLDDVAGMSLLMTLLGLLLALATDVVVFLWLLRVVPGNRHRLRDLWLGALFGAVGFEVMKVVGSYYLSLIDDSVTSSALGGAVGILVWINVVFRFAFFTAAWTATLRRFAPADG
ncbi:YihY/virulence factor BrkB family protein [Blastococcus sp. TF02A-26]|uniref:YihY/virulence factor BrkB family protein n=1 Tax=Blastococcus sp. TF02A-26 TaxID=2250577 RepID=UPI000DE81931|nr:YihY/virulence factor BrkB family protein [Blastococcus sp. TF02A-26]RBY89894.1 YihY/virulence factor BrkB family protein [Blastococcus sp. TF02A-26]